MEMKTKYITQIGIGVNWIDMTRHDTYLDAQQDAISLRDTDGNEKVRIIRRSDEVISEVLDKK